MTDTKPNIEKIIVDMVRQKTGEERLKMGCSMFDMAKEIVMASIKPADISKKEVRQILFLRFYQDSFSKNTIGKILQKI